MQRALFLIGILFFVPPLTAEEDTLLPEDTSFQPLETLARGLFYLETMYVDPTKVKREDIVIDALQGVVKKLDPHTMVMPSKAFKQLTIDTKGKFGGVGIIVSSQRGKLIVVSPIEGTPAYKAGIQPGDEIIAIDGVSIKEFKHGRAADAMRGEPDSTLEIQIKRKGESAPLEFTLVREVIKVKSVRSLPLGEKVLYTRITSFQDETTDELEAILAKHHKSYSGLILDLRDNPGGLLDQAVRVSDLFIESGVIVSTVGRSRENVEREFARKRGTYAQIPMIVLINGGSASASEIVAGALQDHQRALIVGTTSFGKGSVQTLISLPDGSGLKVTVARYYTPKDRSIQAKGIKPDIYVTKKKATNTAPQKRKEADLKGHIESQDLSELANSNTILKEIEGWPEYLQQDHQLVTAYTYLKGLGFFQKQKPTPPPAKKKT